MTAFIYSDSESISIVVSAESAEMRRRSPAAHGVGRSCVLGVVTVLGLLAGNARASDVEGSAVQSVSTSTARGVTGSSALAITGSGRQAITGSGRLAITGSGRLAITGSGRQAITGSGRQAITGSGRQAITGSGRQAITGSGRLAITGSGRQAITGSGRQAITGSGGRTTLVQRVSTLDALAIGVMGPVEQVAITGASATVTVLGQHFVTTAAVGGSLDQGDYISVGSEGEGQPVVVEHLGSTYVPGVSTVAIKGFVAEVNPALAIVLIGETAVDYSAQLSANPNLGPARGELVELSGVQPLPQGTIISGIRYENAVVSQTTADTQRLSQDEATIANAANSGRQ